jgi:malonyl-CoA O-methyltransferase
LNSKIRNNNIQKSFSKASSFYSQNATVQNEIINYIIQKIIKNNKKNSIKNILDLGSGNGNFTKNITETAVLSLNYNILAVDFSQKMLNLHPKNRQIKTLNLNFDDSKSFEKITQNIQNLDLIVSLSALQWSQNLTQVLKNLQKLNSKKIHLALFTSQTYIEIQNYFDIKSPILSLKEIKKSVLNVFDNPEIEILNFNKEFKSSLDLLKSIKNSGVSGSLNQVKTSELRELIKNNSLKSLSYQVICIDL